MSNHPVFSRSVLRWALLPLVFSVLAASCSGRGEETATPDQPEIDLGYEIHAGSELDGRAHVGSSEGPGDFRERKLSLMWHEGDAAPQSWLLEIQGVDDEVDYDLADLDVRFCGCEGEFLDTTADDPICGSGLDQFPATCFPLEGELSVEALDSVCGEQYSAPDDPCVSEIDATVIAHGAAVDLALHFVRNVELTRAPASCNLVRI